ncbi:MAG TPA: hypothetical protein VGK73_14825 [Polyangiaceae bacterium]
MSTFRAFGLAAGLVSTLLAGACSLDEQSDDDDDGGAGSSQAGSGAGTAPEGGRGGGASGSSGTSASGSAGTSAGTAGTGTSGTGGSTAGGGSGGSSAGTAPGGSGPTAGSTGAGTGGGAGTAGTGGAEAGSGGGAGTAAGAAGTAGTAACTDGTLGCGNMTGTGRSEEQYATEMVSRNDVPYILITNGWGPGFESHAVSWNGTSFIVETMAGSRGSGGQPASYPSVFCGRYSVMQVPDCGLPARLDAITSLKTGWRWKANDNVGAYNAAYDIWLGTDTGFGMYLMVWLRDPPGEQPAGSPLAGHIGVTVANTPGTWNIWQGTVNNRPIINWVRAEGMDSDEIEFDVMDFVRDAQERGLTITGTQVNAVAVGFEIWSGPVTNLESVDFYVDVN